MDQLNSQHRQGDTLVIDLGNSAAKGGVFRGGLLDRTFRMSPGRSADAFAWESSLREAVGTTSVSAAGLSSVIPAASDALTEAVQRIYRVPLVEIHHTMKLPIELAYQTPQTLGTDRLAAAAAAHVMFGQTHNVVVVDAGTAVTFEVIDRTGVYRGGCIAPGPAMMQHSLHVETAQLPEVPLEIPANPIGRSTREALQAGILYGMIDSVRGMIHRLSAELDEPPIVVATGGWGELLAERIAEIHRLESHLVLHGIRILMDLNTPGGDDSAPRNES